MAREPVFRGKRKDAEAKGEIPVAPGAGTDVAAGLGRPQDLEDARYDDELRPQLLTDVVGQQKVITRLKITLDAAKMRNEPLGHLLLDGPPGLGKTTLATVIPRELGTDLQITSGPSLSAPRTCFPISPTPVTAPCSSSMKSIACRRPSKSSSIRQWKIFGSTSRWARG